jgi:hypothetical protein
MLKCYGVSDFALSLETPGGFVGQVGGRINRLRARFRANQ